MLAPERLRDLLAGVLEVSGDADALRKRELEQAKAEHSRCRTAVNRLLELVEQGLMTPGDPEFSDRLSSSVAAWRRSERRSPASNASSLVAPQKITSGVVDRFGAMLKERLLDPAFTAFRKGYVRLLVEG